MNQKENLIIESLLNEEESITMSIDKTNTDELTSWFKNKKDLNLSKKITKSISPDIILSKDSKNLKPILHPGFHFPKLSPLRCENHLSLAQKVQKTITKKTKIVQKTVQLEDSQPKVLNLHKKSDSYLKRQSKKSSVLKSSEKRTFSMIPVSPSSSYFLFSPSKKLIKYKKTEPFTSNLFKNSSSNLSLNKLKNKSKLEISDQIKDPETRHHQKSPLSDSKKLKKNFLLSPILENLCKYSSALK